MKPSVTLIFPATHPDALEYHNLAQQRSESTLAAASIHDSTAQSSFGTLAILPYIHDPEFGPRFIELVQSRNIRRVFSPVASCHIFLSEFLPDHLPEVTLIGASPIQRQVDLYRNIEAQAANWMKFVRTVSDGTSTLTELEISALLLQAMRIYGESGEEKLIALAGIFADTPQGDVIEVGVLMGRTAFALHFLARLHQCGPVLAIDPWNAKEAVQQDSPELVQTRMVAAWDTEVLHRAFLINLLPAQGTDFNFLRATSRHAFAQYGDGCSVMSAPFGRTNYSGQIAVIHIDGNHDYSAVSEDCDLWLTRLVPGGWLVLDDYLWAHGDGPYRKGNEILSEYGPVIQRAFTCGKALFIKIGNHG